ncbi:MAG: hypothetical protein NTW16_06025, partial [Bacteroidetes bacterium]|nr:hypothetical protein [Bacteroidota bacterium]
AYPTNGCTLPTYQWAINGFHVGTNADTFTCIPANGDIVNCQMMSSLSCTTVNPVTSNSLTMNVIPVLPVNLTIAASANPVCTGTVVTYTANPYNGGSSPVYQWKINGVNAGAGNPFFSY